MANYENFYGGATYSLEPSYSMSVGYQVPLGEIGASVDARTANQIKEVSEHLNTGIKNVEVAAHSPEVFESMPKQHTKELNRLAKLTGAELSLHAPMVDPTGITQHGWQQLNQDAAEKQLWSAVERSHDLNPEGNVPVTIHTTTAPLPPAEFKIKEKGEEKVKSVLLIDPNGNLAQIKEEERYFPAEDGEVGKRMPFDPVREIQRRNEEIWLRQIDNLNFYAHRGEDMIDTLSHVLKRIPGDSLNEKKEQLRIIKEEHPEIVEEMSRAGLDSPEKIDRALSHAGLYLRDAYTHLKENYDLIYKNADQKDKEKLNDYAREIFPHLKDFEEISQRPEKLDRFSEMIQKGVSVLANISQPKLLTPLRDFAIEKSAETTATLAFKSYKKFGKTAPIIALENHPAGTSILTRAEDMREVIEKARNDFVEKAKKEGMSASQAREAAEKIIGATWDVGHINMLRRYGYEEEDIIKETKKIAPYVKHVHLSDNFGYEHTELPMGMGNVPTKEILKELEKKGFKGKKVVEALSWWQHFSPGGKQNPPFVPTIQALSSPIYPMKMAPSWDEVYGTTAGYFAGQGDINPEIHHSLYGAGFSTLPTELGGPIVGDKSRQTGTPMA